MLEADYDAKIKRITKRNPQSNAILERVHLTIGNMLRTFQVPDLDLDEKDPWSRILGAIAFAVRSTLHTTLKATPMQLVFGRDAMLNIPIAANWKLIQKRKQKLININKKRENLRQFSHTYKVGEKVLIKVQEQHKYGNNPYKGPYKVLENRGSTCLIDKGRCSDIYNIRQLKPYYG